MKVEIEADDLCALRSRIENLESQDRGVEFYKSAALTKAHKDFDIAKKDAEYWEERARFYHGAWVNLGEEVIAVVDNEVGIADRYVTLNMPFDSVNTPPSMQ